jgi:hypothetical protein
MQQFLKATSGAARAQIVTSQFFAEIFVTVDYTMTTLHFGF